MTRRRDDARAIADAEAAVAELADTFLAWIAEDVRAMAALVDEAATTPARADDAIRRLRRFAHDIRGQGTSIGYPLLTALATAIGTACRTHDVGDAALHATLHSYVTAMGVVIGERLTGDGGARGHALMARLAPLEAPPRQARP